MALSFPSPKPRHHFRYLTEMRALDAHFAKRGVPKRRDGRLLVGTWNVANLGVQGRSPTALRLIAHVLARFELIAVQEVKEQFRTFEKVVETMGPDFGYMMTDTGGNQERLAFIFDRRKVAPKNMFGELALRDREFPRRDVRVPYRESGRDKTDVIRDVRFRPFDRNPYIGTFEAGRLDFTLVNCHLYFGSFGNSTNPQDRARYARRVLEIHALSRWADRRRVRSATYDRDIILLGDMNVPAMTPDDSAYTALVEFGMKPVDYQTRVGGTNLGNDKTYDQMAFAPGAISRRIRRLGVFDFDNAVFGRLWRNLSDDLPPARAARLFAGHIRHHLSDHRPLWVQLDIR